MTKKETKKVTKKTVKPEVMVNCVNVETSSDAYKQYILAKVRNNKPITEEELNMMVNNSLTDQANTFTDLFIASHLLLNDCLNCPTKKTPWYKKLWNKIKSLFKKNK